MLRENTEPTLLLRDLPRVRGSDMGVLFRESKTVLSFSPFSMIFGSFSCRYLLYLNITGLHYNRAANVVDET